MEIEDVSCPECGKMFESTGPMVPRLIPDNGMSYCIKCLQALLDAAAGREEFVCP